MDTQLESMLKPDAVVIVTARLLNDDLYYDYSQRRDANFVDTASVE